MSAPQDALDDPASSPVHHVSRRNVLSTGLAQLDAVLSPSSAVQPTSSPLATRWSQRPATSNSARHVSSSGGIRRGEITEVMGPRGVGKTAIAMGVAARALLAGEKVLWIDTAGPVCESRLRDILRYQIKTSTTTSKKARRNSLDEALKHFLHFHTPSLAHLMALVSNPPPGFPPQDTGLIVIDNISTLFNSEFKPILPEESRRPALNHSRRHRRPPTFLERQDKLRWKLIGSLLASLRKLAVRLDSGVLAINEMGSRFRPGCRPMLHQALSGVTWEMGVSTRIVLYFAWLSVRQRGRLGGMRRVRIAEVLKTAGAVHRVRLAKRVVPYLLLKNGICDLPAGTRLQIRFLQRKDTVQKRMLKRKTMSQDMTGQMHRKARTDARVSPTEANREEHGITTTGNIAAADTDRVDADAVLLLENIHDDDEEFT